MTQTPAVESLHVTRRFNGRGGCVDVTLRVEPGEVFGLLGPNGAGKSTFVKTLLGLLPLEGGVAWIVGNRVTDVAARQRVGYLPEHFRYYEWLEARELLRVFSALHGRQATDREIDAVLELVGLPGEARKRVGSMSKGMQQRLGLALALLPDPDVLFLDEPTSALDPIGRRDIRSIIQELRARGKTVFLNSHLLSEVEMVCDRVGFMDEGRIILTGSLHELLCKTSVVEVTLGSEPDAETIEKLRLLATDVQFSGRTLRLGVSTEEIVPAIVRVLVSQGAEVYGVVQSHQSLEDVFVQLVRRTSGHSHEKGAAN